MQVNGNSELLTVANYWPQGEDPRLIVLVLNNQDLNQVTWEMPLPPYIKREQARAYMSALMNGDPESLGIVTSSVRQFARSFIAKAKTRT